MLYETHAKEDRKKMTRKEMVNTLSVNEILDALARKAGYDHCIVDYEIECSEDIFLRSPNPTITWHLAFVTKNKNIISSFSMQPLLVMNDNSIWHRFSLNDYEINYVETEVEVKKAFLDKMLKCTIYLGLPTAKFGIATLNYEDLVENWYQELFKPPLSYEELVINLQLDGFL